MQQLKKPIRHSPTTTPSLAGSPHARESRPVNGNTVGRPRRVRPLAAGAVSLMLVASCGSTTVSEAETPVSLPSPESATEGPALDIQGHRGARGLRPENTLPAFEVALDLEVSTLELDLHFSADDQVVVWHDPLIDPAKCGLGDSTPAGLPDPDTAAATELSVRSLTADQLRALQCDRNPHIGRYPDQRADPGVLAGADYGIVTLAELFAFVDAYAASEEKTPAQRANAERVGFNIETKRAPNTPETIGDGFDGTVAGPFELATLAAIEQADRGDRVTVQSFDHRSLKAVGAEDPSLRLAALTRDRIPDPGVFADWGADIWSPSFDTLTADAVQAAHAGGLLVIPWTINDPADMQQAIDLGVDGLITDRPDRVP